MLDDPRNWYSPEGLSFCNFQDPKLSDALKIFRRLHSESLIRKTVKTISQQNNQEGIQQGIRNFWFAFILFALNRLKNTSDESDNQHVFDFFANASRFFVNAGPVLVEIYGDNKPKFDIGNMSIEEWMLRVERRSLFSKPIEDIERFLCEVGGDVLKEEVAQQAELILGSVFSVYRSRVDDNALSADVWAQMRKDNALKVYYMFMGTVCCSDPDATSIVRNNHFHRCALACSAEVILACTYTHNNTIWLPDVLKQTGITAFDLCKVIEFFLKCEFPNPLRWHLSSLMERLLESVIWEKGSSMYDALMISRPHLSAEILRLGLSFEQSIPLGDPVVKDSSVSPNSGQYSTARYWRSLFKGKRRMLPFSGFVLSKSETLPLGSAFASPYPRGGMGECTANTIINLMLGKILELSAFRIGILLRVLGLVQHMYFEETVNCLVQHIISRRIDLFFNRHIDQIVLCSVYSVLNILKPKKLSFKKLLQKYSFLCDTNKLVCDSVFLDGVQVPHTHSDEKSGQHYVDIATFYKEMFDPCVRPLLAELGLAKDSTFKPCSPIVIENYLGWASGTIEWLGEKLKLPQHVLDSVHGFLKEILKRQTSICFNRHIDQIVLCSLYHILKILKFNISFMELIKNYITLPDVGSHFIHRIYVDWSQVSHIDKTGVDHVDIVTFYCQVFAVSVKPLLAKIGLSGPMQESVLLPEVNGNCGLQPLPAASPVEASLAHFTPSSPKPMSLLETLQLTSDAADTVNEIVERLELSQQIKETVHRFIKQVLAHHTALALNRHIDQIVLCSIYCVAKASNLKLPFKEVIQAYSKLPRAIPQIRNVYVDSQDTTGENQIDISTFYKKVFEPSVRALLVPHGLAGTTSKLKFLILEDQPPVTCSSTTSPHTSVVAPKKYPTPFAGVQPVIHPLGQHNQ